MADKSKTTDIVDRVLRVADVARRYGLCAETVRRWERVGALPPRRVFGGGMRAWLASDIDNWMQSRPRVGQGKFH